MYGVKKENYPRQDALQKTDETENPVLHTSTGTASGLQVFYLNTCTFIVHQQKRNDVTQTETLLLRGIG